MIGPNFLADLARAHPLKAGAARGQVSRVTPKE